MTTATATPAEQTVFIVDDDAGVRDSLSLLLSLRGFRTTMFAGGEDFLATCRPEWCGCALIDIRMGGIDGLQVQQRLQQQGITLPVIIITAHGDAASARSALKTNAVDFLEKPIDDQQLIAAIETAFDRDRSARHRRAHNMAAAERIACLSGRELEVMRLIAAGQHNREIAQALGISPRTVEVYRARLMEKLRVRNLSELILLAIEVENEGTLPAA